MQVQSSVVHCSILTKEQKEKIASGPGLEEFASGDVVPETSSAGHSLKSKSGER